MLNTQLSNYTVDQQANQIITDLANGYLRIYTAPQPASADNPILAQTLLAELRFTNPSAPSSVNGVITFTAMAPVNGLATGQAAFYRCLKSDGTTTIMDGSVGRNNANMVVSNTLIVSGARVTVTDFTHTVEKAAGGY